MRNFLKLLLLLTLFNVNVSSIVSQSTIQQLSHNYYSAGVNTQTFNYFSSFGKQRADNWCWAACVQMVLNYHGLYITQEQIVAKCFGNLYNKPGGPREMFIALNGWAYNNRGGMSKVYTNSYPTNAIEIQQLLANNWPLIVGLNYGTTVGHAYVLTAIYYSISYDNRGNQIIIPDKVVLRDPWPGKQSRQEMSWNDFTKYVVSIYKVWIRDVNMFGDYGYYFRRKVFDDKKDFNWVFYSGYTNSPYVQSADVRRIPIPIYIEKSFNENAVALRNKTELFRGKIAYEDYYNLESINSTNYFANTTDLKLIWNRKYRINFWIAPTLGVHVFKNKYTYYTSVYNFNTGLSENTLNEEIENLSGLSYGLRFGFDRYTTRRFYISSDFGWQKYKGLDYAGYDFNLILGYRFNWY